MPDGGKFYQQITGSLRSQLEYANCLKLDREEGNSSLQPTPPYVILAHVMQLWGPAGSVYAQDQFIDGINSLLLATLQESLPSGYGRELQMSRVHPTQLVATSTMIHPTLPGWKNRPTNFV